MEKAASDRVIVDLVISCHEFDRFWPLELIRLEAKVHHDRRRTRRIHIVEKEGDWYVKDLRELQQPARAYAISTEVVLLNLLEREPDRFGKLFLTQPKHLPPQPHARTDMHVDRVRTARAPQPTIRAALR
jgi:hypothetical protein